MHSMYEVPEWAEGAVLYQIFPDRFCSGTEYNEKWEAPVRVPDYLTFYGGSIEGICQKLDYLKELGVEIIYLNPIFESPTSHGYDISDFRSVSQRLGGNEAFARLCREVHIREMKIILDGVFNHCSIRHPWVTEKPQYFNIDKDGNPETWWNVKTMPKLNYEGSEELQDEILQIAQEWLKPPYCIDGWRLDVAADLGHSEQFNHSFWKRFRRAVKEVNPDALIVAEHYGNPDAWLGGDEWDTVMNYDGFMEPVTWFLTGMEKHSDYADLSRKGDGEAFRAAIDAGMAHMPYQAVLCAMNQLDNHDHSRFLTRTNGQPGRLVHSGCEEEAPDIAAQDAESRRACEWVKVSVLRQAVLMQATLPGMMGIYYGDEAGLCGWTDPDNRRPYPWGHEDTYLRDWYKSIIALRKRKELRTGKLVWLKCEKDLVSYARILDDGVTVAVIYTGQQECTREIPLDNSGLRDGDIIYRTALTDVYGYDPGYCKIIVEKGRLELNFKPDDAFMFCTGSFSL